MEGDKQTMFLGNTVNLSNGLRLCVDWISWTLEEPCCVSDALSMMGYSPSDFHKLPTGLNGYRLQLRHCIYPISIQYDGKEGMGIHVDVSGSAVSDLLTHFKNSRLSDTPFETSGYEVESLDTTIFCDLLTCIKKNGHVTRFDLAVDDIGTEYYTMSAFRDILSSGAYISKFRGRREMVTYGKRNEITGFTLYLGSRSSDIMLRVYDKQLEQNVKLLASGDSPIMYSWVRWELELKKKRAQQAADCILSGMSVSEVAVGILSNYLCIINLDNPRKDRCTVSEKWEQFIAGISKLSLYRPQETKTIDDTKNWLFRQVAPSLAMVVLADGGSIDCIEKLVTSGSKRLKESQKDIVTSALGA